MFQHYWPRMQNIQHENFSPPSDLKTFHPDPSFAMKIMSQPHRKSYKLNFHWKICIFFKVPFIIRRSKLLRPRAPFFVSGYYARPLTSVCERSLNPIFCIGVLRNWKKKVDFYFVRYWLRNFQIYRDPWRTSHHCMQVRREGSCRK